MARKKNVDPPIWETDYPAVECASPYLWRGWDLFILPGAPLSNDSLLKDYRDKLNDFADDPKNTWIFEKLIEGIDRERLIDAICFLCRQADRLNIHHERISIPNKDLKACLKRIQAASERLRFCLGKFREIEPVGDFYHGDILVSYPDELDAYGLAFGSRLATLGKAEEGLFPGRLEEELGILEKAANKMRTEQGEGKSGGVRNWYAFYMIWGTMDLFEAVVGEEATITRGGPFWRFLEGLGIIHGSSIDRAIRTVRSARKYLVETRRFFGVPPELGRYLFSRVGE